MLVLLGWEQLRLYLLECQQAFADVSGPVDVEIVDNVKFPHLDYHAVFFVESTEKSLRDGTASFHLFHLIF